MRILGIFLLLSFINFGCKNQSSSVESQNENYDFLTDSLQIDNELAAHNLAGFSLAIIDDYEIIYSKQFGLKSFETSEKIDENTAFSTASISKPITALLCLILEEKGLINLEDPIEDYLKRWKLPESQLILTNKPNWLHFLNHTSGTSQHGFADFYEGDYIPSIVESLYGKIPRYDKEIEFQFSPGDDWSYSGGGYVIIQMALEDELGKSLAELASEYLFDPLGLENTTMVQPNEDGFLENIALVHDKEGKVIKTGLPITPQVAPSGMWSTPNDLAKIVIRIQKALKGDSEGIISQNIAQKALKVTALKNAVGGWSYGWQRSFGFNEYDWFSCNGSNTGVGGDVFATMTGGKGFIILANGDKPNRFPVIGHARNVILSNLDWQSEQGENEYMDIPDAYKEKLAGVYHDFLYGQQFNTVIKEKNGKFYVESPFFEFFRGDKSNELLYTKKGYFKIVDYPNLLKFNLDQENRTVSLYRDEISVQIDLIDNKIQ